MPRLLMATHNFAPRVGGIEHYTLELARALHALGVDVHVVAPEAPGARSFDAGEPYRVERYRARLTKDLDLVWRLERELGRGLQHVLCMQWTAAAPFLAARRLLRSEPRTFAIQCYGKELLDSFASPVPRVANEWVQRRTLAMATHVFAISAFTASLAEAHGGGGRVHLVRPGVDAARFAGCATTRRSREGEGDKGPHLLSVARLVPRKGIDTVLCALPTLLRQHPGLRYRVAGEGPDRARLEGLARELGVAGQVTFLGRIDDAALLREYAGADLFALPSRSEGGTDVEGFGMVCLEAQAAGVPVVAGSSGGVPDALRDGETGLLVDPTDPEALADAVGGLLGDRPRLERMADAALAHARASSWTASARRMLDALGLT